jgi:hypothetical protein
MSEQSKQNNGLHIYTECTCYANIKFVFKKLKTKCITYFNREERPSSKKCSAFHFRIIKQSNPNELNAYMYGTFCNSVIISLINIINF